MQHTALLARTPKNQSKLSRAADYFSENKGQVKTKSARLMKEAMHRPTVCPLSRLSAFEIARLGTQPSRTRGRFGAEMTTVIKNNDQQRIVDKTW